MGTEPGRRSGDGGATRGSPARVFIADDHFVLKKGSTVIPATVSYTEDGTTFRAVLTPTRKLKAGVKYAATVTSGATDAAGNALISKSWTFTVRR